MLPTGLPFRYHWYDGEVPPFVGDAEYVAVEPTQTVSPGAADILTTGVNTEVTYITITLLVTVDGLGHTALLDMLQVIMSVLTSALLEYVGPIATGKPFTNH